MAEETLGAIASEVPPVAAPNATSAPETTAVEGEVPEGGEEPGEPQARTFDQKEVDRIVAKRVAQESRRLERVAKAEARAEFAERRLAEREQAQQPAKPQGEPKPTDFKDYESYIDAKVEYRLEQTLAARESKREQETSTQRNQREAAERADFVRGKLSEGADKYEDFEEVALADHVPNTEAMAAFIVESADPAGVAYYLGKHLDEAAKIAKLTPAGQFRELLKIEGKLTASPSPTRTPPPIRPSSENASVEKKLEDASIDEFFKIRRRQIAASRGR